MFMGPDRKKGKLIETEEVPLGTIRRMLVQWQLHFERLSVAWLGLRMTRGEHGRWCEALLQAVAVT